MESDEYLESEAPPLSDEEKEQPEEEIEWEDVAPAEEKIEPEPEAKEEGMPGETTKVRPPTTPKLSPGQLKLGVIGVIILIILSATGIYLLGSDDSDVVVNVPELRKGDEARYTVTGNLDIRDAGNDPIADEITSGSIDLKGSSMNVKVVGIETVTDGFYHDYPALKTNTFNTWKIAGWVQTESYQKVDIDGTIHLSNDAYRNGETILLSDIEATTNIDASDSMGLYTKSINSEDDLRTYSSVSGNLQGRIDTIIHQKDLKKGMNGEFTEGEVKYHWEVIGNEKVYDTDCVVMEFKVIEPLPEHLAYQSLKLSLSNKHPFPVKTELKLTTTKQGRITLKYTMTMNRFNRGKVALDIPSDTINGTSPYLEKETMELYPPTGSRENTSIGLEIEIAHERAVDESSGLQDYLNSHEDAYLVQGIYNETDGPHWNFTYSYPDATDGYVVLVTESEVDDKGEMPLSEAGAWLEVPSPAPDTVLTWAGAEQVLKHDDEVKDNTFIGEGIRFDECNLRVRTRLYQPSVDLVSMFASAPRVDYGYVLVKKDYEFAAGVDANTGQLLFVYTHSGDSRF